MHGYLITGRGLALTREISLLVSKLKAKRLNYEIQKIDDVRNLNRLVGLSLDELTAIVIENINNATDEASNAFLKNLEEPQANLFFILTAPNEQVVLSTIVSRCQVIKTQNLPEEPDTAKKIAAFIDLPTAEKLAYLDKIKKRDEAEEFLEKLIFYCHELLHKTKNKEAVLAKYLEFGILALRQIRGGGNIGLQLTNMVLGLVC
jgi:hypothetical protein